MPSSNSSAVAAAQADAAKVSPIDFLKSLFAHTTNPIYVCSFPNDRDDEKQVGECHIITRMPGQITSFVQKWNKPGRGLFFCVGTVKTGAERRAKENIAETIGLHADIDFKNVEGTPDRVEALRQLKRLKYQPSVVVFSGGGLHCYWLFKEPLATQENIERIEMALRQLADVVAGDLAVCEVARVLRVPGSHNTKNGAWTEVEVIYLDGNRRHELDDLEEWLSEASPVLLRKKREHAIPAGESDFFAEYARQHGIKAPIDVEARLAAMMFMGGENSSIHQTQLAVSAALLNKGVPVDEVVAILMDATRRAAGEYSARWNWPREERKIRGMCATWLKKHPPEERKPAPKAELRSIEGGVMRSVPPQQDQEQQQVAGGGAQVIPMPASKSAIAKKSEQNVTLGQAVLAHLSAQSEALTTGPQGSWLYSRGIWELRTDINAWLNMRIEQACVGLGFKSGTKLINEARGWILRRPELWREEIPWDQHGKIPTRSGLIDPITGELEPARPDHFCTWRVECDYDRQAECPWWLTMIADFFADRDDGERTALIGVVQEILGAALIDKKPRALSKALVLWGGSNFGKSGVLEVLGGLFGSQVISVPLKSVEKEHGLMPFTRRLPWVLHEAFAQNEWHFSSNVKAIITHEPVMINVKNGPIITQIVRSPLFWGTNHKPQFKEATKAMVNRIVVIHCRREFPEGAPLVGAAAEAHRRGFAKPSELILAAELQGLLNWAIEGLQRALQRNSIALTDSIKETSDEIRRDANLVAGFLEECIEYDPMARIKVPDFCLAHSAWWLELKGEDRRLPSNDTIGNALSAMTDPRIAMHPKELRDGRARYYCGIALNKAGLRYHKTAYESSLFEGKITTATNPDREVNSLIPPSWGSKTSIVELRERTKRLDKVSSSRVSSRDQLSLDDIIDGTSDTID